MRLVTVTLQYVFFSAIIGVLWMIMTAQLNLAGWGLGMLISLALLAAVRGSQGIDVHPLQLPVRLFWLVAYLAFLTQDVIRTGWDVALRILGIRPIESGIIKVAVTDERQEIAALTAHGITITPGQMVVDFDHVGDERHVYVHCLDVPGSLATLEADQARRMRYFKRILGDG